MLESSMKCYCLEHVKLTEFTDGRFHISTAPGCDQRKSDDGSQDVGLECGRIYVIA